MLQRLNTFRKRGYSIVNLPTTKLMPNFSTTNHSHKRRVGARATGLRFNRIVTSICFVTGIGNVVLLGRGQSLSFAEGQGQDGDKEPKSATETAISFAQDMLGRVQSLPSSLPSELPTVDSAADYAARVLAGGVPAQIGYGFVMGFSSGFCLKKVSRLGALVLGGGFVCLQGLASHGYITVNHDKLKRELEGMLDLDGDGDVDGDDASVAADKVRSSSIFFLRACSFLFNF